MTFSSYLVALFITYHGGSENRTKWIALSSFGVGFGSLSLAFSYFSVKSYESEVKTLSIADASAMLGYSLGYAIRAPQYKSSQNRPGI